MKMRALALAVLCVAASGPPLPPLPTATIPKPKPAKKIYGTPRVIEQIKSLGMPMAVRVTAPPARTNLLISWTTSKPVPGMSISNQLAYSTDLKTWLPFLWVKATGSNVVVSIAIDPKAPRKFFKMGTNAWGP